MSLPPGYAEVVWFSGCGKEGIELERTRTGAGAKLTPDAQRSVSNATGMSS